jgi:hypothetical protein
LNEGFKIKKLLIISILIIGIASISGCISGFPYGDHHGTIHIHEIEDIGNGTYFEITDDELKGLTDSFILQLNPRTKALIFDKTIAINNLCIPDGPHLSKSEIRVL